MRIRTVRALTERCTGSAMVSNLHKPPPWCARRGRQARMRDYPTVGHDLFDLSGRTALVTGSSRGIGLTLARGLGRAGARVVLNGRDGDRLAVVAGELRGEGLDAEIAPFDVTDEEEVDAAVARIEGEVAAIDILVNNAGMQLRRPLQDFSHADWQRLLDTNVTSAFLVGRAVGRRMLGGAPGRSSTCAQSRASWRGRRSLRTRPPRVR